MLYKVYDVESLVSVDWFVLLKARQEAKIRNRYNQVPIWESDKTHDTSHTRERAKRSVLSQQVTTRPQGTDKTAWQWQIQITNNKEDPQKTPPLNGQ